MKPDGLEMTQFDFGYFDAKGKPCYQLHDYRGNVAVVVAASGKVLAHNRYYPYGETITRFNGTHAAAQSNATATAARYRFGAKEHETMHGLNAYDFGPRLLSASLPVWDCPDRQQERYHPLSPYTYCAANPIRHTDPSGEKTEIIFSNTGITYRANFYCTAHSLESLKYGISILENQNLSFVATDKNSGEFIELPVTFDLEMIEVEQNNPTDESTLNIHVKTDDIGNGYSVVPNGSIRNDKNIGGTSMDGDYIKVTESRSLTETSAHEQLHNLGLEHSSKGIMTPSAEYRSRSDKIYSKDMLRDLKSLYKECAGKSNTKYIINVSEPLNYDIKKLMTIDEANKKQKRN